VNAGESATFSVTSSGATTYQWQRNGQNIAGASGASYVIAAATSQNNDDRYSVVASNAGGAITSDTATLRVTGVSVVAGQPGGMGYADGPAAQARFWGPIALTFDGAGNLYVADYNALRMIAPNGMVSTVAGSPRTCGSSPGTGATAIFCYPYSLTVDGSGNVDAGDNAGVVWQITPAGAASVLSQSFVCPFGMTTAAGSLFVSDQCAGTITRISNGASSLYASVGVDPLGLSTDGLQNLYVANDTVVQQVTPSPVAVSSIAGSPNVPGSADGAGAQASFGCLRDPWTDYGLSRFNGASGIATTPAQLSYVSDFCNNTIRAVTALGDARTLAGNPGTVGVSDGTGLAARFWGPAGMALDAAGNVFVADYNNALIRKVTPGGVVSTYAGAVPHYGSADGTGAAASFRYPRGIAADAAGNLYVADGNHTIRKITLAGVVTTLAGAPGVIGSADGTGSAARFCIPSGTAMDAAGNLYVADRCNYAVRVVTPAGVVSTLAGLAGVAGQQDGTGASSRFSRPTGVALDSAANVYVADGSRVRMITPAGAVTTILASIPTRDGAYNGVAVDSGTGVLYVTTNRSVYSVTAGGAATLLAGGGANGSADGTGSAAQFNFAWGIVMGRDGNLYVADQQNSTIRKVTRAGVVTTPVGTAAMPMGIAPGGLPARIGSPFGLALLSSGPSVSLAVTDEWESVVLRVDLP
jgi:NHL repeat